jgi:hypothetical protein
MSCSPTRQQTSPAASKGKQGPHGAEQRVRAGESCSSVSFEGKSCYKPTNLARSRGRLATMFQCPLYQDWTLDASCLVCWPLGPALTSLNARARDFDGAFSWLSTKAKVPRQPDRLVTIKNRTDSRVSTTIICEGLAIADGVITKT